MNGGRDREELLDLVALDALGVLPAAEHEIVRAALRGDPELAADWSALRGSADAVGLVAEEPVDTARSARMRERLLAAVREDAPRPGVVALDTRRATARTAIWGTALAAAAAVVLALVTAIQNTGLRGDLAAEQRRVVALQEDAARSARVDAAERRMLTDLVAADARRYPTPQGDVVVRGPRIYLALRTLPALPKGKVYQAWTSADRGKTMTPSVTFVPDPHGVAVVELPQRSNGVDVVAVSVEPEGGSRKPTSTPTLVRPLV